MEEKLLLLIEKHIEQIDEKNNVSFNAVMARTAESLCKVYETLKAAKPIYKTSKQNKEVSTNEFIK